MPGGRLNLRMKRRARRGDFYSELQRRLEENRKLYRETPFVVFEGSFAKFVASNLGVNPWKILVPVSALSVLFLRLVLGERFSDIVLRVLGG